MQKLKSGLTALAVGIVLLAALDWAAAAATGKSLVLGKWNEAGQTTTIKNTGKARRSTCAPTVPPSRSATATASRSSTPTSSTGSRARTTRPTVNTIYQWTVAAHTGGFTQAIPTQAAGSYLITFNVQLNGAAGDPANPNVINCRIIQNGVSGAVTFQKGILAETPGDLGRHAARPQRHQPGHPRRR